MDREAQNIFFRVDLALLINWLFYLGIPNEPRKTVQHNDKHDIHKELEKEVQTEAFIVYPYEHLFSDVWPQQMSNNKQIKNVSMPTILLLHNWTDCSYCFYQN